MRQKRLQAVAGRLPALTTRGGRRAARALHARVLHSLRTLSAHSISRTRIVGLGEHAFFPCRSAPRTPPSPRARGLRRDRYAERDRGRSVSAIGGQPTGTTAGGPDRASRDPPRRQEDLGGMAGLRQRVACRNGMRPLGSVGAHALLTRTFMLPCCHASAEREPGETSDCHGLTEVPALWRRPAWRSDRPAPAEPRMSVGCPD